MLNRRLNLNRNVNKNNHRNISKILCIPPRIPTEYICREEKDDNEDKIISVIIRDRLGNQFFEIISCWAYAKKHNMKMVLSDSYLKNYKKYYDIFFNKIDLVNKFINFRVKQYEIYEKIIDNPDIYNTKKVLIYSYLQNSKNFDEYRNEILDTFFNIKEIKQKNNKFFIHIRLTDFLISPQHNINLDNYYIKAINYISSLEDFDFNNTLFYIVSDDIDRAKHKNYLRLLPKQNITYVDNKVYDDIKTLELFKECCKGAIIGHSTFAWWGAYIINCPEKIVICPNRFLKRDYDFSGFYMNYKVIDV